MDYTNLLTKGSTQTLTFRVKRNVDNIVKSEPTDDGTSSPKAAKVITTPVSSFGSACSERQSVEKNMQLAFGSQPNTSSPTPSSSSALYRDSLGNVIPPPSGTLASAAFNAKPFDFNDVGIHDPTDVEEIDRHSDALPTTASIKLGGNKAIVRKPSSKRSSVCSLGSHSSDGPDDASTPDKSVKPKKVREKKIYYYLFFFKKNWRV